MQITIDLAPVLGLFAAAGRVVCGHAARGRLAAGESRAATKSLIPSGPGGEAGIDPCLGYLTPATRPAGGGPGFPVDGVKPFAVDGDDLHAATGRLSERQSVAATQVRATYKDPKGRIRLAPPDRPRKPMAAYDSASAFVGWIRAESLASGEWEWSQGMVEAFDDWCAWEGVESIPSHVFLEALGKVPGVEARRRRLGAAELAHIRMRTSAPRAECYRIATDDEMVEAARAVAAREAVPAHERAATSGRITVSAASRRLNRAAGHRGQQRPLEPTPLEAAIRKAA